MSQVSTDLLNSCSFLAQALNAAIGPFPGSDLLTSCTGATSIYLLRTLSQSPLSSMVRGFAEDRMSFSQVESSLVQGLIDSDNKATAQYFIQSLLRFGSQCERALRNENEGAVEKVVILTQIPEPYPGDKLVLVLVYEPIGQQLWTYRHSSEELTLLSHFADFDSIEEELNGSGIESICFDVQAEFKQFPKRRGNASWDQLLDFAHDLELSEDRPAVQILENNALFDSTFSTLKGQSRSSLLQKIANRTSTEIEFEVDGIGWFEQVIKSDLIQILDSKSSEYLRLFLHEHTLR